MLAKVYSCALVGLEGAVVEVEADLNPPLGRRSTALCSQFPGHQGVVVAEGTVQRDIRDDPGRPEHVLDGLQQRQDETQVG